MKRPAVGVFPAVEWSRRRRIFSALGTLFDVEFVAAEEDTVGDLSHMVVFADNRRDASRISSHIAGRTLAFVMTEVQGLQADNAAICFSKESRVSACFRGQSIHDSSFAPLHALDTAPEDCVLATYRRCPWWIRNGEMDVVSVDLSELAVKEHLFERFCVDKWAALLPVLQFLQEASPWTPPQLRACFMFDDPNLHWKTYGYVNYHEMSTRASAENYCAAFATVPMDAWYVNQYVAATFHNSLGRLSLLAHGNDHTTQELMRTVGDDARLALSSQALRRLERLERKSGLRVARVMAAPHGACDVDMARALAQCGFEAACISRGSLMGRNSTISWPPTVGLNVSEVLGSLPIVPRFNIKKDRHSLLNARFSAFLGQAVIPVGHHDDVSHGLGLLSDLAASINSMGDVQWMSIGSIAETNFCWNREGSTLTLKMYTRRVRLTVGEGVEHIVVRRPWLTQQYDEALVMRADGSTRPAALHVEEPIAVRPGQEIEVIAGPATPVTPHKGPNSVTTWSAIARRQVCEGRDRARPIFDRIFRNRALLFKPSDEVRQ